MHKVNIKQKINKNKFLKNVLTLMTGTTIAQIIPVLLSPVLTRLYNPEDFGLLALYISIATILSVIITGRYELAVMSPKSDKKALNIVFLSCCIALVISLFVFIIIVMFKGLIVHLLGYEKITFWLYFIPITIFFTGIYQTFNYWTNRKKKYGTLAIARVLQNLSIGILNLSLYSYGIVGLIGAFIIGQILSSIYLITKNFKVDKFMFKYINKNTIKKQASIYIDYPKKSSVGAMLNTLSSQLPMILIGIFFDPIIAGYYALTLRVLNSPMNLIGKAVSQVFFEQATVANRKGDLNKLVKKTTKVLALIILVPMIVLLIFGKDLFSLVFGSEWNEAGEIVQLMVPFFLVRFIFSSQSTILMVKKEFNFELKFNLIFLVSQLVSIYIGYYYNNYSLAFSLMSLSGFIIFIFLGAYIIKISKKEL